ncbi:MAG: hypothetical protein V1702_03965 [Candidatus Woesearchaeota archaeon]
MPSMEELKTLSPEERIKRLKEIEESKKKEIEEAETLISESMREIGEAKEKKDIPIPQMRAENISQLLTAEEKSMFATKRFVNVQGAAEGTSPAARSLEEVAGSEAGSPSARRGSEAPVYGTAIEKAREENNPMDIYNRNTSVTTGKVEKVNPYESGSVTGAKYEKREEKRSSY